MIEVDYCSLFVESRGEFVGSVWRISSDVTLFDKKFCLTVPLRLQVKPATCPSLARITLP